MKGKVMALLNRDDLLRITEGARQAKAKEKEEALANALEFVEKEIKAAAEAGAGKRTVTVPANLLGYILSSLKDRGFGVCPLPNHRGSHKINVTVTWTEPEQDDA